MPRSEFQRRMQGGMQAGVRQQFGFGQKQQQQQPFAQFQPGKTGALSLAYPTAKADPADMWKGWVASGDTAPDPVQPRNPMIESYAAEIEAEADEDNDDDDEDEEQLSEDELSQLCLAKNIQLHQLENNRRAVSVIRQFDRLDKSSVSTLKNEYKRRGFAPDAGMRKEDLLARVKEVVIWENLKLDELRILCLERSLPADGENLSRPVMIQLLADTTWLERGIPVQQLPNLVVAHGVLDSVDSLASKSLPELLTQCRRLGLPLEAKPDKDDILPRIRTALVWKQMDEATLRKECEKRGAPLDDVPDLADQPKGGIRLNLNSNTARASRQLMDRLVQSLWLDVWKAAGISVQSLGSHEAAGKLFADVEKLRSEDFEAIQLRYRDLDLPMEQVQDVRFVKQRVSEALFWEALAIADLREECAKCNITVTGSENDPGVRRACVRQLAMDSCIKAWAKSGIPVERINSASAAASIAEEWRSLESVTNSDLKIKCEMHGVPPDALLEEQDLVQLLKDIAVWEALPVSELEKESARLQGPGGSALPPLDPRLDEFSKQCQLVERLLLDRCAEAYEAKGIPARRFGSLKAAARFSEEIRGLEAKSAESLKQDCQTFGLPAAHLQRQELLDLCRDVALWRALPLPDLRLECRARGVNSATGIERAAEADQRTHLIDALLVEKCEAWYERRGIPVRRLASVQAAARVSERWEQLESLSEGGLLFKASAFSIHVEKDLARKDLLERLRSAILWGELPLKELQKICRKHGVNSIGREDQRREMVHRITSTIWAPPPPPPPPPPEPKPRKAPEEMPGYGYGYRKAPPQQPPRMQQYVSPKIAAHFRTLGLPPNSAATDVKKAYRRLALRYHPDKNVEASKEEASRRFREVAEAYSALSQHLGC
eukprot:TRINITY_DN73536_c0_g1_i1.p1 TRINITY_DN73536_c0_g1~~TRINITY_DN73536_c0_g1_i1.p1  ORF type:complete len:1021 (-),score=248.60 TRINITY_DN73536_c0_g1_i1:293-2965(-)